MIGRSEGKVYNRIDNTSCNVKKNVVCKAQAWQTRKCSWERGWIGWGPQSERLKIHESQFKETEKWQILGK